MAEPALALPWRLVSFVAPEAELLYQTQLDLLTAWASSETFKDELLAAKAEYFAKTGEIFEDDRSFEPRMAAFLEFYLFDRAVTSQGKTPAQLYIASQGTNVGAAERAQLEGFSQTQHSLYEVRKLLSTGVRVRDLFTAKDQDVFERRSMVGMQKGDVLEARLIPSEGRMLFSQAFCYHPKEARSLILKEIKRQKKKPTPGFTPKELIFTLSKMALKVERYRNIAVENIYAFDKKTI